MALPSVPLAPTRRIFTCCPSFVSDRALVWKGAIWYCQPMRKPFALLLITCALVMMVALSPVRAAADGRQLQICNQSSAELNNVVIGYYSRGSNDTQDTLSGPFVSIGYWSIAAGKCASFANPFNARYIFWWGHQNGIMNTSGGADWTTNGGRHFCIPNVHGPAGIALSSFTFEDENESEAACEASYGPDSAVGHNIWVPVRKVDLEVNPTVTFN